VIRRSGSAARRRLEFATVAGQVRRDKQRLIDRINRHCRMQNGCYVWVAGKNPGNDYPQMNFRHKGKVIKINVPRVILILKLCAPIPMNIEAGHASGCANRACILHIEPQHWKQNLLERDERNGKRKQTADAPF
jgi:hypothetical protein